MNINWILRLEQAIEEVVPLLDDTVKWNSLVINRRRPHTYRAFIMLGENRVCLHRFESCHHNEAFKHPHPWPGAFKVLEGEYVQRVGWSFGLTGCPPHYMTMRFGAGSVYEISDRHIWHSVQPLTTSYTIMINGPPWENPHSAAPTTKGKDLDRMSDVDLRKHLDKFKKLLKRGIM